MKNNDEISWLVNEIKRAQDAYYNGEGLLCNVDMIQVL